MIKVSNLFKSYKVKKKQHSVLDDISFEVGAGQVYGIIGRSGAGKSTLIKCLNLLEVPDSGSIMIDGVDITKISAKELRKERQQIGVIFQHFNLLSSKTIFENIALPLVLQSNYSKEEIKEQVNKMLQLVGLQDFANKYPASLSGGQKQRVGIARALITKPKLLLSDEATSALDPQTTASILELLLEINQKLGITIVLITHELEVVRKICDKVAVIDSGKIIEEGDSAAILLHPKEALTRKLVIEEGFELYLENVKDFYSFEKSSERHIILLSFIGENTYQPVLSNISKATDCHFSILRGELDRIKNTPFGQLLIEFQGSESALATAKNILKEMNVHYEIIY
ncbi:MAG: ATP-binding cassette domain-containing protein [Burkholderiales bacterium]|nr:ATP-binding cassette domain-containing protein [Burkholderiales bacterium]